MTGDEHKHRTPRCPVCGEILHSDEEWRLRPEIPPGTLETEVDEEYVLEEL